MSASNRAFPKNARLLKSAQYQRVFDKPQKSSDRLLVVLARENGGRQARLGLAISRKCSRRAVDRNRIKRVLREVFRQRRSGLADIDCVVLCRPVAASCSNSELAAAFASHLDRVRSRLCGI